MIDYRALFRDLVGEPAGAVNGSAATDSPPLADAGDAHVADTQPEVADIDSVAAGPGRQLSRTDEEELAK
jgi:hypothetical protein